MFIESGALRCRIALAFVLGCTLLTSCSSLGSGLNPRERSVPAPEKPQPDSSQLANCFETLDRLAHAPPSQQAEIMVQLKSAVERSPSQAFDELRYALALALPGHGASDAAAARLRLRQLVVQTDSTPSLAHAVAALELQRLDREAAQSEENRRLVSEAEQTERERIAPLNKRLQSEIDENVRLHRALDEARAKLDAIMNIERSITERKPAGEVRSP